MNNKETFSMTLELREALRAKDPEAVALPLSRLILEMYDYLEFERRCENGQCHWLNWCGANAQELNGDELEVLLVNAQTTIYNALLQVKEDADKYIERQEKRHDKNR